MTKRSKYTYEIEFNTVYPETPEEDKNWLCGENLALALNEFTKYKHDFKVKQL